MRVAAKTVGALGAPYGVPNYSSFFSSAVVQREVRRQLVCPWEQ